MLVKWLLDGEGPSPTFAQDGKTVRIPAGTIMGAGAAIGDSDCWHLCFPDNSGDKRLGIPGTIYCEPADAECQQKVDETLRQMSADKRRWYDLAKKRTAVLRKEQLAKAEADAKAGLPPMPLHPDLVEDPESPAA